MKTTTLLNHHEFTIEGMSCASCVGRVERIFKKIDGVHSAYVNLATSKASVECEQDIHPQTLAEAVTKAGYPTQLIQPPMEQSPTHIQLSIEQMTCASCVGRVERILKKQDGVKDASVQLNLALANLETSSSFTLSKVLHALEQAGYPAKLIEQQPEDNLTVQQVQKLEKEQHKLKKSLLIAVLLGSPVFILEMGSHLFPVLHHWIAHYIGLQISWYIQLILTTAVILTAGRQFYRLGIPALLRGAPDMNSLVALGTIAAYLYSITVTLLPDVIPTINRNVYYESVVVIIALILLGRFFEAKAKSKTSDAIRHLLELQPATAHVIVEGSITDIPTKQLQCNDIIIIRPGEKVPIDGVVIEGKSHVDESMMTGETVSVTKKVDDQLIGGTINQDGSLKVKVTATDQNTVLAQIIRLVEQAQGGKLPIQMLVDKITLWFVPIVLALAFFTFLIWYFISPSAGISLALINAVAVLIIACPCAMGLATPTSIMVATGRAAELGVLFKESESLQRLQEIKIVAFDKTGTLTQGQPTLTDFITKNTKDEQELLQLLISIELLSEHPIAKALAKIANQQHIQTLPIDNFKAFAGHGISGSYHQKSLHVGAARYMKEISADISYFIDHAQLLESQGKTPLYFAIEQKVVAIFAVADQIKPETKAAIDDLKSRNIQVAMISGDNFITAKYIANQLGIEHVIAEVLPEQKVEHLNALKSQFGTIAFVGDGINDAPALAFADVGIAIGTGTDVAIESADVILMSGKIEGVNKALEISHATLQNIKQNLFWAFAYNVALIPVAMGVFYPITGWFLSPIFAAGAMALSSVFVVTNALRLKGFTPSLKSCE